MLFNSEWGNAENLSTLPKLKWYFFILIVYKFLSSLVTWKDIIYKSLLSLVTWKDIVYNIIIIWNNIIVC